LIFGTKGDRSKRTYLRESTHPTPAARDILQLRHSAAQRGQSAGTFPLDEGFQSFSKQRGFLGYAGEFLRRSDEIVIKRLRLFAYDHSP